MIVTRRNFVAGCAAGALLPTAACRAAAAGTQVAPEGFGAIGDGVADDYEAFQRMAAAVNSTGGGTVTLRPGRTYFLNRFIRPNNGITDVIFRGCSGLTIKGNGAAISTKGDFFRDARTTRGLAGLRFEDCSNVQIRNVELIGNVQRMTRAAGLGESATHGLVFDGCSDVTIDGVTARHFASDGLYITASSQPDRSGARKASRRFNVRNSRFLFNARQGLTVIQLRGGVFENCDFGFSGYIDDQSARGSYGEHNPGASVDIEPNASPYTARPVDVITGELHFTKCRMTGSYGGTFLAAQYANCARSIEKITLDACELDCNALQRVGRYGFIFDVQDGFVTNCVLRMYNKTAFVGWYPANDAQVTFQSNTVYGGKFAGGNPVFVLKPTRGAPLIEGNRFIGQARADSSPNSWMARFDNPLATVRDNLFILTSEAFGRDRPAPPIYMNVAVADRNSYRTGPDSPTRPLPGPNGSSGARRVAVAPGPACR
jgi:hypothetical protein